MKHQENYTLVEEKKFFSNGPRKYISAKIIFINSQNKILIVKPSDKNYWQLPGGRVEAHESPLKAAIREANEEVKVKISEKDLRLVNVRYFDMPKYDHDGLMFTFQTSKDFEPVLEGDELTAFEWFSLEELISSQLNLGDYILPLLTNNNLYTEVD